MLRLTCPLLLLAALSTTTVETRNVEFKISNDCTCPGYITSFQCNVTGEGYTVWRGSVFECQLSGNEILLLHSNFIGGTVRTCNNGKIVGRSLGVTNNCYASQLNVNLTTEMEGRTVECVYESGSAAEVIIGSSLLSTTKDPLPPPSNIKLTNVTTNVLNFQWSSIQTNCASLHYDIDSNCGDCPSTTQLNSVNCSISPSAILMGSVCRFAVKSVVCGNTVGNWSSPLNVTLKVPGTPVITDTVAKYGTDNKKILLSFDIKFAEVDPYSIFEGVISSANCYTVVYANTSMGRTEVCGSTNISSSSCVNGVCTSSLPSSCYNRDGNITVSVSATNDFGRGTYSTISIDTTNQYVDVIFTSAKSISCEFADHMSTHGRKSCSIRYGPCQQPFTMTAQGSVVSDSSSTIKIDLDTDLNTYCYFINASNGTFALLMEGNFGTDLDSTGSSPVAIIIAVFFGMLTSLLLIICFVIFSVCHYKCKLRRIKLSSSRPLQKQTYSGPNNEIIQGHDQPLKMTNDNRRHPSDVSNVFLYPGTESILKKFINTYNEDCESDAVHVETTAPVRKKQTILAHVVIELKDQPWELLKALEIFKLLGINIVDIFLSGRIQQKTRKVYLQCEKPFSNELESKLNNRFTNSVVVHWNGVTYTIKDICQDKPTHFMGYKYTRYIPWNSGALYELLNGIRELSVNSDAFKRINIVDIMFRSSEISCPTKVDVMVVDLWFVPELPHDWTTIFNKNVATTALPVSAV